MSIFGTGVSKFVGTGTPGSDTVIFEHSILAPEWCVPNEIIRESILTGKRDFRPKGSYSDFQVIDYLAAYSTVDAQNKAKKALEYKFADVNFYPYVNNASGTPVSNPVQKEGGGAVLFHITDVRFLFKTSTNDFEYMVITFKSHEFTDPSLSITGAM